MLAQLVLVQEMFLLHHFVDNKDTYLIVSIV